MDLVLVVALLFSGYLLVRLNRKGVIMSNIVLGAEVLYWIGSTLTPSLSSFTNFGLSPQILTAYPLLAIPVLNWGARRLDQGEGGWRTRGRVAQTTNPKKNLGGHR